MNTNQKSVDLKRLAPSRAADPWEALDRFVTRHSYGMHKDRWQNTVAKLPVSHGKSRAVLDVSLIRAFTGDIKGVSMWSTTIRPKAVDPPDSFSVAIELEFSRKDAVSARECRASLDIISRKPTHGVQSGTDALDMALAICRHVGCDTVSVNDASSIGCTEGNEGERVSLRRARMLARGAGWYESRGFRSIVEVLNPKRFRMNVGRLHTIRIGPLMDVMAKLDAMLRQAIVDRDVMARIVLAKYDTETVEPQTVSQPTFKDIMSVANNVSVALEVMTQALANLKGTKRALPATLGAMVDHIIANDCTKTSALVDALLPDDIAYFVIARDADGKPAPQLPMLDAWVYAWRVTRTFGDLTLGLGRRSLPTPRFGAKRQTPPFRRGRTRKM